MIASVINILKPKVNLICQVADLHVTSTICALLKYPNHKMVRDVKVRKTVEKYYFERLNLNCLRKNKFMPREIKEAAHEDLKKHPLDACFGRIHKRCMVSSKPRGLVTRFRLSRIVWRNEADYNKLSGIQRAMW